MLESGKKFSAADMLALQTDIYSDADRYFAERFVYAVDHARNASARAKQAAELMRGWDGRMTADSAAPTIAYRARAELARLLLEPKLGAAPADPKQAEASAELEDLFLGNAVGVAGKCGPPSAAALAAARLCQLRRSAGGGG